MCIRDSHTPFRTHALRHGRPAEIEALSLWLRLVTQLDGPRLLRIKALVRGAGDGGCWVLQSAGRSVSPPLRLGRPPDDLRGAEVVLIERGLPDPALRRLLASLRAALEGRRDTRDRRSAVPPPSRRPASARKTVPGGDREP